MALNIKNPETHHLARELAERTGESLTEAVTVAIRERLASLRDERAVDAKAAAVREIQSFVASLPDRDTRSPEEILGYDERGLPR